MVVSSIEAAIHPSSVDPPSHMPTNAAMLLKTQQHITSKSRGLTLFTTTARGSNCSSSKKMGG